MAPRNGTSVWQVSVSDEATAETTLLRHVLADQQVAVIEFSRKKYELEEIFIEIVKGDDDGR